MGNLVAGEPGGTSTIEREMMVIAEAVGDGERIIEAHLMRFLAYTSPAR